MKDFFSTMEQKKQAFESWWVGENESRPLMVIQGPKVKGVLPKGNDRWVASSSGEMKDIETAGEETADYTDYWTDFDTVLGRHLDVFSHYQYPAETFPRMFANLGVANLALFLGCEPVFHKDTIWYTHAFQDIESVKIKYDEGNRWLAKSLELTEKGVKAGAGGASGASGFMTGFPDITENLDVLAELLGTQELLFAMMDEPEIVKEALEGIQAAWFKAYEAHDKFIRTDDDFRCYGPFQLLGKGRIAKLQCDMSATISCDMFDEFALPHLEAQANWLDKSLYHLDGKDAIRHLDSVLSIKNLKALQWTAGAGQPDGGDETWDFIYEKALNAGKSIYALVAPQNIKRFVKRFGHKGVIIITQADDEQMGLELIRETENICKK